METDAIDNKTLYPRYRGYCSVCRKSYKDVGPLAEGPDQVYLCLNCALACVGVIHDECKRLGIPLPGQRT